MTESRLIGFVRLSKKGGALKIQIEKKSFNGCETYESADGKEWVQLIINLDKVRMMMLGEKEVTAINHLEDSG